MKKLRMLEVFEEVIKIDEITTYIFSDIVKIMLTIFQKIKMLFRVNELKVIS